MGLNRFQPLLIAALLPLLIVVWFVQDYLGQIDFWLLWLVAMTLVGLPLVFAEVALAQRSGTTPLVGLPKLTREADIASVWRGFGWVSIVLLVVVIGHLLASSAEILHPMVTNIATPALLALMVLLGIGLSFAKQLAGWLAVGLAVMALVLNMTQSGMVAWQMTATSLSEWAVAVLMASVCVGAGTGLLWHTRANQLISNGVAGEKLAASRAVLPIWLFQLVGGALVAMTMAPATRLSAICYALAMLAGAAYLLYTVTEQLSLRLFQRPFNFLALVIMAVVSLGVAMVPTTWLNQLLTLLSLVTAIWLAVFAGWQMKISHMRKSLNFGSEGVYNLWRIAVRVVVPIAVVLALVGWVMRVVGQA